MTYDWRHIILSTCLGYLLCWMLNLYAYRHYQPRQPRCRQCKKYVVPGRACPCQRAPENIRTS